MIFRAKKYADDEKKGKEEVCKRDQDQKRQKKNEVKQKKIHKNGDGEKKGNMRYR